MFVIQSMPRCGTHLVLTALQSHPDLTCYGEVLNPFSTVHGFPDINPTAPKLIKHCKSAAKPTGFAAHAYVGLGPHERGPGIDKEFLSQKTVRCEVGFWHNLPKDCKVVTLRRDNLLERYVSMALATKHDIWRVQVGDPLLPPTVLTVNIPDMLKAFERTETLYAIAQERFPDALMLSYEEIVEDTNATLGQIQRYLGVKELPIKPTTVKTGRPMHETLVNYTAVQDAIRGTQYEHFLTD